MTIPKNPFIAALLRYGFATAAATYLIWALASDVSGRIQDIQASMHEHTSETAFYLRAICLNVAKDDVQRAGCVLPREHR